MFNQPSNKPQTPTKERNSKTPESKLSLLTKTALTVGTLAVVNISYNPIKNLITHNNTSNIAVSLQFEGTDEPDKYLDGSYPLYRGCDANDLKGEALRKALDKCGEGMNWTQEEIDYERKANLEVFAMLFLFWLDIGGGSPKPSVSQIDTLATQVSKTPKQSATFRSSTGERVTLRSKPNGTTLEAEIRTSNGKTIKRSEPVNRNKPRSNEKPRSNPRELEAPCLSGVPISKPFDVAIGLVEVAEANNCLKRWDNAVKNSEFSPETIKKAEYYYKNLDKLEIQTKKITGGSTGDLAEGFIGKPNSIYPTKYGNRVLVTNESGSVILDIDLKRIKMFYTETNPAGKIFKKDLKYPDFVKNDGSWLIPDQKLQDLIQQINQ